MSESLTRQLKITKQAVRGKGVVVAQNCRAAEVGAEILRKGGNAIDAAVATGMAIGALEPWMSGIGGVGFMTIWSAKEGRAYTIDYGPISAKKLDPKNYKIVGRGPANAFSWPEVLEARNEVGYHSIAVPGLVAGLAKALERFGTMKWKDVMAPAVKLAERGMELDWYMQVMIANGAGHLSKFPASRANYLCDDGRVPTLDWQGTTRHLKLGNLGETYRRLAEGGPREFYEGSLARDIAADLQAGGSAISVDDLKSYEARVVEPLSFEHHGATINVAGGLTAGPTLRRTLELAGERTKGGRARRDFFVAIAEGHAPGLRRAAEDHGRQADQHLHHAFLRRRFRRQHGGADANLMSLFGSVRDAAQDRHHHEQRHAVVRSRARPAQLDRAGQAAAVQHLPRGRGQGRQAVVRHRRLGRPAHRAGGGPAFADADRPRPRRRRRRSTSRASTSRASARSASTRPARRGEERRSRPSCRSSRSATRSRRWASPIRAASCAIPRPASSPA